MAIAMQLIVGDKTYKVLDCKFTLQQPTDYTGRPTGKPGGGIFHIIVEGDKDNEIFEWVIDPTLMKNCKLVISSRFGTGKSRTIELLDCFCLESKDHYNSEDNQPYTVAFSLSPATMINNGEIVFSKFWRKTDPAMQNVEQTVREVAEEGSISESYFEDKEGNKIDIPKKDQDVYYVLQTQDMVGKSVDIDFSDSTINFEYEGAILPDDQLTGFNVTSDTMRISLKTVKQN